MEGLLPKDADSEEGIELAAATAAANGGGASQRKASPESPLPAEPLSPRSALK